MLGHASYPTVLVRAGIERAKGLFAVMGDDRDNLLVVLSARGLARVACWIVPYAALSNATAARMLARG